MADPADIDRRGAALRSAYARQIPVGTALGAAAGAVTGLVVGGLGGSSNPAIVAATYAAIGIAIAAVAAGAGFFTQMVVHEILPRPAARVAASAAASALVVAVGVALALAVFRAPPPETAVWAGVAALPLAAGCALWAERRAARVPAPPPRDVTRAASAVWPVFGGALGVVLGSFALMLVRDQLHIGCTLGSPGTEGAGAWTCQGGLGYLFPAIVLGAVGTLASVAGALVAGLVRRTSLAAGALVVIAFLAPATVIALTVQATAAWSRDGSRAGYWLAAVGPAAACVVVALAGAAALSWAPARLRGPGLYAAAGLMALATLMQPGLALGTLPAAGCLLAAAIRISPAERAAAQPATAERAPAEPAPAEPQPAASALPYGPRLPAPEAPAPAALAPPQQPRTPPWLAASEPVLWIVAVVIAVLAWVWTLPRLPGVSGCTDSCSSQLLDLGVLILSAGAIGALALSAAVAVVLHRMRRGRAWASVAALALVVGAAVIGTVSIDAGVVQAQQREAFAEPPAGPPATRPPQPEITPEDPTPRDPTGTWAVPGTAAYVRIEAGGALALSDGCVEAVGTWALDAEGIAVFTVPEPPVSCDPTGQWVLLARSGWAREGWIALRDESGGDIGGLPRAS